MKAVKRPEVARRKDGPDPPSKGPQIEPKTTTSPTTVELRGVPIHFPFKPYECQERYMEKVLDALHRSENALLESPTGTGKTLCLLCATLAWQRQQARLLPQNTQPDSLVAAAASTENKPRRVPTILYASRTHSQLSQVVRELRNTRYRPRHAVLGSREQMCVHPKVKTTQSIAFDINHDCNKLNKDRKCRFRNNLEGFVAPNNESGQGSQIQSVMDIESLVEMGKSRKVCPFYYTRSLVSDAELILIPYNYLFDKDARETTLQDVPWDNAVVIFDEAHNLESFASESASFDLTSADIGGCISEMNRAIAYVQVMPEMADRTSIENLARLKAIFMNFEEFMLQRIPSRSVYSGDYMMEIFRDGASINHANHVIFLNELQKVADIIMEMQSGNSKGTPRLDAFATCVKRVFGESTEGRCLAKARAYRVHVSPKEKGGGRTISYWCFAPSLAMQELADLNVRSILVTSGTLSPLPSYSLELGLSFPHTLENPHIINEHQIHVRVIGHGVSGKLLNSSYNRREDSEYITELGNTLVSLARIIPGGMLIFFPSYGVMETCIAGWGGPSRKFQKNDNSKAKFFQTRRRKSASSSSTRFAFPHEPNYYAIGSNEKQTPWKRLLAQKAVIVEPKSTSDLPDAIAEFHKFLAKPKSTGCVLMGVCRGKISEGIDFAHEMCRAVVITGLPFAPYLDPKVKLKREYLDGQRKGQSIKATGDGGFGGGPALATTLSGAEWYTQQAHRAVNQAIGRVIRNKSDYGAVLLLDSRFGEDRNQQGLSKWVRPHIQNDEGFGATVGSLVRFFKEAKRQTEETKKPAPKSRVVLEYENEAGLDRDFEAQRNDESMTKIAVVQKPPSDSDPSHNSDDQPLTQSYIPPDKVIARMDLKENERVRNGQAGHRHGSNSLPARPVSTLEAAYEKKGSSRNKLSSTTSVEKNTKSAWSNITSSNKAELNSAVSELMGRKSRRETIGDSTKKSRKTPAVEFFEMVKARATQEEIETIKKSVIEMKKHGDKKDEREYMRSAKAVVAVLIRYEHFDNIGKQKGMLDTLFLLLPTKFRDDVKKMCLRMQFEKCKFYNHCVQSLSQGDCKHVVDLVLGLLESIDRGILQKQGSSANSEYLRECKPILEVLHKEAKSKTEEAAAIELFLRLIPAQWHTPTWAFFKTFDASTKVKRIKDSERAKMGEGAIDTALFSKSAARMVPLAEKSSSEKAASTSAMPDRDSQIGMEAALMNAEAVNRAKRERLEGKIQSPQQSQQQSRGLVKNPYLSKKAPDAGRQKASPPSSSSSSAASSNCNEQQHTKKPRVMAPPKAKNPVISGKRKAELSPTRRSQDPIARCLREVENDSYVKQASGVVNTKRKIQSNAPSGLKCGLCEKACKEHLMADCGHTACSNCWWQWLKKSSTCPVCRVETTKESLACMVFEKQPGAGAPSFSQLCASDNVDDGAESSDEELEIVQ